MRKKINLLFLSMILTLIAFLSILTVSCGTKIKEITGNVSFYVLSIGSGNFTFLEKDGHAVVMDSGVGIGENNNGDSIDSISSETFALNNGNWVTANPRDGKAITDFMKNTAGVQVIDAIFISHKHSDHYSALKYLVQEFEVGTVIAPTDSAGLEKAIRGYQPKGQMPVVDTNFSKTYEFLGGTFENLTAYSSKNVVKSLYTTDDPNANSMVLRFKVNGKTFLLPGDMENTSKVMSDKKFLKAVSSQPVDFYLLAHHGSTNGATELTPLIGNKERSPEHIIISGTDNIDGFENWSGQRNAVSNSKTPVGEVLKTYGMKKEPYVYITGSVLTETLNDFPDIVDKDNVKSTFEYKFSDNKWDFITHEENISNRFKSTFNY
ncbi:ComEC/Rec2 family competence protein [Mesoplasma florum]|uniref:ComEC/Rec2 family competence protein n=1 Tax=Mesoplasma florum TaxID=2151 RepID=UPI0018E0BA6D|nr:MBL fold metallo-hydrolase [Mesoplasma florum]